MSDSWMLRKLEPGLVEQYSRSSVFMTSTMKSEPGRSTTMSPGSFLSFLFDPCFAPSFAGASCSAASGDCASTVPAATPAPAAAVFRNVRRSTPAFFSSSIRFLLAHASQIVRGRVYHRDSAIERRSSMPNNQPSENAISIARSAPGLPACRNEKGRREPALSPRRRFLEEVDHPQARADRVRARRNGCAVHHPAPPVLPAALLVHAVV